MTAPKSKKPSGWRGRAIGELKEREGLEEPRCVSEPTEVEGHGVASQSLAVVVGILSREHLGCEPQLQMGEHHPQAGGGHAHLHADRESPVVDVTLRRAAAGRCETERGGVGGQGEAKPSGTPLIPGLSRNKAQALWLAS